jgi:hypothetical protein
MRGLACLAEDGESRRARENSIEEKQSMVRINGTVIDKLGIPRQSTQIWAGSTPFPGRDAVKSDKQGRFVIEGVKTEQRSWLAHSHSCDAMGLFTIPGNYAGDSLVVSLDYNRAQAEGLVLDAAGRPLPQKDIEILLRTPRGEQFRLGPFKTKDDGRYSTYLLPSKPGVKIQARLISKDANEPQLQTSEITLSNTDLFVELPPIAPQGVDVKQASQDRIVVSGVIVDDKDKPIPSVRVNVMYEFNCLMLRETIADNAGRWRLPLPAQASNIRVRLMHPDFISFHFDARGQREPSLAELQTGRCKLVMERGLTITGIIDSQNKEPIENTLVTAGRFYGFGGDGIIEDCTTARTAKDGSFSISGLPTDKIDLMVFAEDFSPKIVGVDMQKQTGPVTVTLTPGRTYRGQVVDSRGNPIDSVKISHCRWVQGVCMKMLSLNATTDSNGLFAIPNVPDEGAARFIFGKRSGDWQLFEKQMPEDLSKTDQIAMFKAPVFTGKVIDAETNEPVKSIDITSGRKSPNEDEIQWYYSYGSRKVISSDGSFRVKWEGFIVQYPFEEGAYLKIESLGYLPAILGPAHPNGEQQPFTVRLVRAESPAG